MQELCASLLAFLLAAGATEAPLPPCPSLVVVAPETLARLACSGPCEAAGAYYAATAHSVYLPAGFDADDVQQRGILLHELVHYLQDLRGEFARGDCHAGLLREVQAFRWQERYLQTQGAWQPVSMALLGYGCAGEPS